jgi:hypothetical protein
MVYQLNIMFNSEEILKCGISASEFNQNRPLGLRKSFYEMYGSNSFF